MKFTCEVTINRPRQEVITLFDNIDNMKVWQEGLQSFEHISGNAGHPGAKLRLVYDMNGRVIEMTETIIKRNLPDEFTGTYDAHGVHNVVENYFVDEGSNTRWTTVNNFQFRGFMAVASIFMRPMFRRQTMSIMNSFKRFAETK